MTQRNPVRIGMIVPSSNTAFEPEIARLVWDLDDVTVHVARVRVTSIRLDGTAAAQFDPEPMVAAAALLADAGLDAIAWAGTAGSWLGAEHDRRLIGALSACTGVPATTSTLALIDACRQLAVSRVSMVTPYRDEVVERIVATYAEEGITVVAERHLGMTHNHDFGLVPGDVMRQMAADCTVQARDAQAVLVVCTNLRATPLIADLEKSLGVAFLDSIAVTLWHALTLTKRAHAGSPQLPGRSHGSHHLVRKTSSGGS